LDEFILAVLSRKKLFHKGLEMKYLLLLLILSSCSTFQCEKDADGNCKAVDETGLLDHGSN